MLMYSASEADIEELWKLPFGHPEIDPYRLARAVAQATHGESLDFRTRLLIRDSLIALRDYWGNDRFEWWLNSRTATRELWAILRDQELSPPGFTSLRRRLVKPTKPEAILRYVRRLCRLRRATAPICVGGRTALILMGRLTRRLNQIDLVEPSSLSLPDGWMSRATLLVRFMDADVRLVHLLDVLVGKLFDPADDTDDFRCSRPQSERAAIEEHIRLHAKALRLDPRRRKRAERNWYIVFGDRPSFA